MSTHIQWTDDTFNCITGCTRVSEGCRNCYAERLSGSRLRLSPKYVGVAGNIGFGPRWTGTIRLHPDMLTKPLTWRKRTSRRNPGQPWMVFINDMSDTFHKDVPDEFLDQLYAMFALTPWVTWQVLTKRPERRQRYFGTSPHLRVYREVHHRKQSPAVIERGMIWPLRNVWEGVSIENQGTADTRIPLLLETPAARRFVSYEPALGPVDLRNVHLGSSKFEAVPGGPLDGVDEINFKLDALNGAPKTGIPGVDWVIVGGESGSGARPFPMSWAASTILQCKAAGVPCFVKQLGAHPILPGGAELPTECPSGGDWREWPEDLRVRQWPGAVR